MEKKKIIRLTESDIHAMIKESVAQILREGYSGKYFEDQINKRIPLLQNWMDQCNQCISTGKDVRDEYWVKDEIKINLTPFNRNGEYMQQKFSKNSKIPITYHYMPDKEISDNFMAQTSYRDKAKMSEIKINVYFNKNVDFEVFRTSLIHEITHACDFRIGDWKNSWSVGSGIRTYNHQGQSIEHLPQYIRRPMYYLWSTSEFNAWQANINFEGGIDNFTEKIMMYLEQANNDNNPETWEALKAYLTKSNNMRVLGMVFKQYGKKDFSNTPWEAVKHYFIKTSFNKLKKFIKKVK